MERMSPIEFWLPLFLSMPRLGIRTSCVPSLPSRRRTILRCDVGSRITVSLRVFMVNQASLEGQFRWTLARSKVISLERARRAKARTESRMASMSRERPSQRRGQAKRSPRATHRLQRSFKATVISARNGDINVLIVGRDNGSKDHRQHIP